LRCIFTSVTAQTTKPSSERRAAVRTDRRKRSRSGRRANDPRFTWRRWTWLFAAYALFMSLRSLPSKVKRKLKFERSRALPS
jgi:hypothetical protein